MKYFALRDSCITIAYSGARVQYFTPNLVFATSAIEPITKVINQELDSYVDAQHDCGVSVQSMGDTIRTIVMGPSHYTFVDVPTEKIQALWVQVPLN